MVRIGLLIQSSHIFSNGISQQGYYTRKVLMNCGYEVDLLCSEKHTSYEDLNVEVKHINAQTDVSIYDLLIFTSSAINTCDEFHTEYMKKLKAHCKIVNMICGNLYFLFQEEFVFDKHHIFTKSKNEFYDEIWVLPMYEFMLPFMEVLFKTKARLIPYVWSPDVINTFMKLNELDCGYVNPSLDVANLICVEPNQSVHKNAFTPICIAEDYYTHYREKFNKFFGFTLNSISQTQAYRDLSTILNVLKDNRVECYPRNPLCNTLMQLRKHNTMSIFVSHQFYNQLNFVHFELLYLGWPLVHNCDRLKDVGYFYPGEDIHIAREQVEKARVNHTVSEDEKKKVNDFLFLYAVDNPDVIQTYQERVRNILSDVDEKQ